jgi:hypothetical protein
MESLLRKLPPIRRAREYHLYDSRGTRYLDLFQDGGGALLGHRPRGLYHDLKNAMQKGVAAELPSVYEERFAKVLLLLIPGDWEVKIFRSRDRAAEAVSELLRDYPGGGSVHEPFPAVRGGEAVYFRPFSGADYSGAPVLVPVLPFPGRFAPQPVLYVPEIAGESGLPSGDTVSPALLAGLIRITQELLKTPEMPDIWKDWDLPGWKRRGCYCIPDFAPERYETVFDLFLEEGVLISPEPGLPTILPRTFSEGEKHLVERLCRNSAGNGGSGYGA